MIVGIAKLKLSIPWVHSLKEKRMVTRSLVGRVRSKFHISIAEVGANDLHQTLIIGLSIVSNEVKRADSVLDEIIHYIESNTEAELLDIDRELIIE